MRLLLTGAGGQVGAEVARQAAARSDIDLIALNRDDLDVTDADSVRTRLARTRPDVVLNAAGFTNVDGCESSLPLAAAVNAQAVGNLVWGCEAVGAHLVHLSTDYVFDGRAQRPYREDDPPHPLSVYGVTKAAGEALAAGATVVRTGWLYGPRGRNILTTVLRLLDGPEPVRFVTDQVGAPTLVGDLVAVLFELAERQVGQIIHVSNSGTATWYDVVRSIAEAAGHDPERVEPITSTELGRPAPRPAYSVLDNSRLASLAIAPLAPWERRIAEAVVTALDPHR